jgi:2-oxoglutarate dehydrogenase E2 component (dihydrolipoamide succinyltransferase)
MATEIRVPVLGESIVEATVGQWFKQAGDPVSAAEPLVELETDKVTLEVPAPASGVLSEIVVKAGETVAVGALLGAIAEGDGKAKPTKANQTAKAAPLWSISRLPRGQLCRQATFAPADGADSPSATDAPRGGGARRYTLAAALKLLRRA